MWGTILNAFTVLAGSSAGLLIGNRLPERIRESVITGLGLVTMYVGISNAGETAQAGRPARALRRLAPEPHGSPRRARTGAGGSRP